LDVSWGFISKDVGECKLMMVTFGALDAIKTKKTGIPQRIWIF